MAANQGKREQRLEQVLNEAVKFQVANRGTDAAFYVCYTMGKKIPKWVRDAERLLAKRREAHDAK